MAWLPNLLTAFRLVLVPVFVVVAREEARLGMDAGWSSPATWIVLAAGASDVADGFLARRWGLTTRLGALLDAVADKSFQFTTLVTITVLGRPLFSQLPVWLVGAVFLRDLVLLVGWLAMRQWNLPVDMEHEMHGRVATVLVLGLVVAATLGWPEAVVVPASALAALAALLSAGAYFRRGRKLIHAPPGSGRD